LKLSAVLSTLEKFLKVAFYCLAKKIKIKTLYNWYKKTTNILQQFEIKNNMFSEMPYLLSEPHHLYLAYIGCQISLACKAAGTPKPILTWYKDGKQIEESNNAKFTVRKFYIIFEKAFALPFSSVLCFISL